MPDPLDKRGERRDVPTEYLRAMAEYFEAPPEPPKRSVFSALLGPRVSDVIDLLVPVQQMGAPRSLVYYRQRHAVGVLRGHHSWVEPTGANGRWNHPRTVQGTDLGFRPVIS